MTYAFTDTAVSILPVSELLDYESVDNPIGWSGEDYGPVRDILEWKRDDEHYDQLVETLRVEGFTKGIRVHPNYPRITDGHHRIAAAIDLGLYFVPVETADDCDDDSGTWGHRCDCGDPDCY